MNHDGYVTPDKQQEEGPWVPPADAGCNDSIQTTIVVVGSMGKQARLSRVPQVSPSR